MPLLKPAVVLAVMIVAACASSSSGTGVPSGAAFWLKARAEKTPFARVIAAPFERTTQTIAATFREMGYPGAFAQGTNDVFVTRQLDVKGRLYPGELNSAYFDCGHSGGSIVANEYAISFVVAAHAAPASNTTTEVEILLDASARSLSQSGTAIPCRGTGKLENLILTGIAARVK